MVNETNAAMDRIAAGEALHVDDDGAAMVNVDGTVTRIDRDLATGLIGCGAVILIGWIDGTSVYGGTPGYVDTDDVAGSTGETAGEWGVIEGGPEGTSLDPIDAFESVNQGWTRKLTLDEMLAMCF